MTHMLQNQARNRIYVECKAHQRCPGVWMCAVEIWSGDPYEILSARKLESLFALR